MCGIAGIIGLNSEQTPQLVKKMLAQMHHRGPDATQVKNFNFNNLQNSVTSLGHNRLKIIDLSPASNQPMSGKHADNKQVMLSFNGEIYNYLDLKKQLTNWSFRSDGDAEVLLNSYLEWGVNAIDQFNGMFAAVIADEQSQQILLFRDRLGIKPLYYASLTGGGFAYASEIKGLLSLPESLLPRNLNPSALSSFFAQGYVSGEETCFESIQMLNAGHVLHVNPEGEIQENTLRWSGLTPQPEQVDFNISDTFESAVKLRLQADVPLAVFLSSGMDSSLLAQIAFNKVDQPIETITIGFPDVPSHDESIIANKISQKIGSKNHSVNLSNAELVESFDSFLSAMDSPSSDGFNTYTICKATSALGFKVALSGLGADELFAGYATFSQIPKIMKLRALQGPIKAMSHLVPEKISQASRALAKISSLSNRPFNTTSLYFLRRELFLSKTREQLLGTNMESIDRELGIDKNFVNRLSQQISRYPNDLINQISFLELTTYMKNMLLRDNDINSMSHSLELRVPFLDHRFVEGIFNISGNKKTLGTGLKPFMQKSFGQNIPSDAERTHKKGFSFPWHTWLNGALKERARAAMHDQPVWEALGVDSNQVAKLWQSYSKGHRAISDTQIVALISLHHYQQKTRLSR